MPSQSATSGLCVCVCVCVQLYNTLSATSVVFFALSYGVPIALSVWAGPYGFIRGMCFVACVRAHMDVSTRTLPVHTHCGPSCLFLLQVRLS